MFGLRKFHVISPGAAGGGRIERSKIRERASPGQTRPTNLKNAGAPSLAFAQKALLDLPQVPRGRWRMEPKQRLE